MKFYCLLLIDNNVAGLPEGWTRKVEGESVKFVHEESNRTTFTDPRLAFATDSVTANGLFRQRFDSSSTALQVRLHQICS